jgi:hypothetical protein
MNLDYVSSPQEASFEKDHWWVRSRFGLIDRTVDRLEPPTSWSIPELGCGTGVNLEHLENAEEVLESLGHLLKPAGRLLVTVPAFQWLWTRYDVLAHHRRRYTRKDLIRELKAAGLSIEENFFLFGMLFPLFLAQRLALKAMPWRDARVFRPQPPWLNHLLASLTAWEVQHWMPHNRLWGSSVAAIACRSRQR